MANCLPELIAGTSGIVLRRWLREDAEILGEAVTESIEHLRPWMPWVAHEPLPIRERRALIEDWERDWLAGGDAVMGVFLDGAVAGGCGLHHRVGPGALEVGYWTHPLFLRTGIATSAARLLTDAAFERTDITHVEIHHDKANEASAGIPRKLGFRLVREVQDDPKAQPRSATPTNGSSPATTGTASMPSSQPTLDILVLIRGGLMRSWPCGRRRRGRCLESDPSRPNHLSRRPSEVREAGRRGQ